MFHYPQVKYAQGYWSLDGCLLFYQCILASCRECLNRSFVVTWVRLVLLEIQHFSQCTLYQVFFCFDCSLSGTFYYQDAFNKLFQNSQTTYNTCCLSFSTFHSRSVIQNYKGNLVKCFMILFISKSSNHFLIISAQSKKGHLGTEEL